MKNRLLIAFFALCTTLTQAQTSFTVNQNTFCLPGANLVLTNTSSTGANFYWYTGDGGFYSTTSIAQGVNHTYSQPGQYYVYVDAYDNSWNYIGTWNEIVDVEGIISPLPLNDNTVCPGDLVYASIWSGLYPTNISWDFGDGVSFSGTDWLSTEHEYSTTGTFIFSVSADFPTCGTLTSQATVTVGNSYPLATNDPLQFQVYDDTICPGDQAEYYVPWMYDTYYINYGDGSTPDNDYYHVYNTTGDYPVTLTLVNGCGNSIDLYDTIHVRNNLPVEIPWYAYITNDTFCINSPVELYYPYGNNYSSWVWNSGNGNVSNESVATFTYPTAGNYIVDVTVGNGCGSTGTITDTVVISNSVPVNGLSINGFSSSGICPNDGFMMEADVNGGYEQHDFLWDFGDGNTATTSNVSHSYSSAGAYTVSLTATNFCGNSSTVQQVVNVGTNVIPNPNDYFVGMLGDGASCLGDSVVFIFGPGSPNANIQWDFGDGNNGTASQILNVFGISYNYVKHKYSALGQFLPEVTYTNSCGNSFNQQFTLDIVNNLANSDVGFFEDPFVYNCQGQPMEFIAFGGSSFIWDFGDGTGTVTSNSQLSPVYHTYNQPGSYDVTVIVTNGCGASEEVTETVIVPLSSFEITTNTISSNCGQNNGKAVAIVDGGKAPFTYQWSNGDNSFIADSIPAGIYVITIVDKNGCENYAIATVSDMEAPSILTNAVLDVNCYGQNNGAIDVSVIGSSSPYTYLWSNGRTTEDVNNLEAGPHEITVTDANGCVATKSIWVNQPDQVYLSMFSQNTSTCGGQNGQASVSVAGTTGPYNYVWSNGMSTNSITGLTSGIYSVVVVDDNGCLYEDAVSVSEGNLNIVTDSITGTGCTGDLANIYINVLPVNGNYAYTWSNGPSTQDNMNLATGTYSVIVTDQTSGCRGYHEYVIEDIPTTENDICIVSVDSVSNTNRVVWEKDLTSNNISHYNVYKESSQAGVYYLVGAVPYDSLSVYVDPVSNPQVRSWRYKISVVDDCGNESALSSEHKTIHLTVNQGISNSYNLIWDHYDGLNYSTYEIYRKTNSSGWTFVTSLPSNLNSYTDVAPPAGTEYYRVEALMNVNCDPTRAGVNTSRSNVKNTPSAPPYGLSVEENELNEMILYPNPTTGMFTLDINSNEPLNIEVYNSVGELLGKEQTNSKFNFDLTNFSRGIYFVRVGNNTQQKVLKVVKN